MAQTWKLYRPLEFTVMLRMYNKTVRLHSCLITSAVHLWPYRFFLLFIKVLTASVKQWLWMLYKTYMMFLPTRMYCQCTMASTQCKHSCM